MADILSFFNNKMNNITCLLDEVESIIESRARSADLSVNNYYDFLYSFHVTRQNFRNSHCFIDYEF